MTISTIVLLACAGPVAYLCSLSAKELPMSTPKPLQIDIVSDVVCPWCYIGKRRIENALALTPEVPVEIHWRPFFLNPWVPREGISRDQYLTTKFGSVEAYKGIAGRVVAAAEEEGLLYRPDLVKRQPNTTDCHRLIHWAEHDPSGDKSAAMKQRLMELYFREGGDLTDVDVLVQAAADIGMDGGDIRKRLATDEDVELISAQAKDASDKGISGVPTFVFAQKYAVSGAQPAEQLARAIRQVSAEVNAQAAE
jgi:predicted DsbA family dithiol-disulfide isomerase